MLCWRHTVTSISPRYPYVSSLFNLPATSHAIPSLQVVTEHQVEFLVSYSKFPLSFYFRYGNVYVSMFLSQFIPSSHFPTVTSLFSMSASLLLPCNQVHQCHFSRFHIYASIYVFVFLFQTYFTLYNRLQAHPHHSIDLNLFLLILSNISLYTCTSTSLSIHLCCFHVLTIVNIAAMHIGIHVSFSVMVSSEYVPCSGIAGSFGSFIPQFLKESRYSSP